MSSIEFGVKERFSPTAQIHVSHPVNEAQPGIKYYSDIIAPIAQSLDEFTRQIYIVLAGEYQGSEWVTSTGYFVGTFENHCSEFLQVIKWRFCVLANFTKWKMEK